MNLIFFMLKEEIWEKFEENRLNFLKIKTTDEDCRTCGIGLHKFSYLKIKKIWNSITWWRRKNKTWDR